MRMGSISQADAAAGWLVHGARWRTMCMRVTFGAYLHKAAHGWHGHNFMRCMHALHALIRACSVHYNLYDIPM